MHLATDVTGALVETKYGLGRKNIHSLPFVANNLARCVQYMFDC
jgi:hypothetical protein